MTKLPEYYASIDIGTQNIVVLVGKPLNSGKLQIVAKSVIKTNNNAVDKGEIKSIDIEKSISAALDEIKNNFGYVIKSAFVGLSGQHILCKKEHEYIFIKGSEGAVEQEDLDCLYQNAKGRKIEPGKEIISILPQTLILDGEELVNPIGMLGNKLEGVFNVVIGDKANISLFSRVLSKCNIEISQTTLSSVASSKAVLEEGEAELGVMVVDIGAGTTDVAIYIDNNLKYLGVIPIGGSGINRDIRSIGVLEKYIERLKIAYGNALPSTVDENLTIALPSVGRAKGKEVSVLNISNIIEARFIDIIAYLVDIINNNGVSNKLLSGIVLTGGVSNMLNIESLFSRYFSCDIRVSTPIESVDEISHELIQDGKYATAVGLLIEGISSGKESVVEQFIPAPEEIPEEQETEEEIALIHGQGDLFSEQDDSDETTEDPIEEEEEPKAPKKSFFDSLGSSLKNFISKID